MADKVIYFPYIRVPENSWFTRVLLYWDEVGSIVPYEYINNPKKLGSYMQELVKVGLVRQIFPGPYIRIIPKFKESFLELIDNSEIINKCRNIALRNHRTLRLHIEKLDAVTDELCKRGLARQSEYPWFDVENTTADLFMAYLASVLGKLEDLQMDPISDRVESFSVFTKRPGENYNLTILLGQLRIAVLDNILPSPATTIRVPELADFKYHHKDLLVRFRNHIESSLLEICIIPDTKMRNERARLLEKQIKNEIDEILAKMKEKWRHIVFGTVCGLVVAGAPGAEAIAGGDVTSALKALPGLITAIYFAYEGSRKQKEILHAPLAYAALAQKNLGSV